MSKKVNEIEEMDENVTQETPDTQVSVEAEEKKENPVAAFVKSRYKGAIKNAVIFGLGFGFKVVLDTMFGRTGSGSDSTVDAVTDVIDGVEATKF